MKFRLVIVENLFVFFEIIWLSYYGYDVINRSVIFVFIVRCYIASVISIIIRYKLYFLEFVFELKKLEYFLNGNLY